MQQNRIGIFWGNPHPAAGSALLEVALIQTLQVQSVVVDQRQEFF
jgi:hypothetical protein